LRRNQAELSPSYLRYSGWTGSKYLIARLIPSSSSVLDIGCSSGVLGKKLLERGCAVTGIEADQEAARIAEESYERVFVGDLQTMMDLPSNLPLAFDILVFADVLEHLHNPEDVLRRFLRYLKPDGRVIASIPNVANWSNRLKLLLGRWQYRDCGILDRTHLKFYTHETARRLMREQASPSVA